MVRQIRKAGRDDSDDEDVRPQVVSKPASKPKPVFSGFDDEDASSSSSSSSANKSSKFKKIRQAPDAGRALMQVDPEPLQNSSTSSYTHDSLQELRQSQKFSTVASAAASREMAEMEGMELVGDEAESLEERLASAQEGDEEGAMLQSARGRPTQEDPDIAEDDGLRRVSMARTEQRREFVPVGARESEWEGEMMRRGGNIGAGGSSGSGNGAGSRPPRSLGGIQQGPSMSDISRALEQAKQSLTQSTSAASRRLAQLQAQHDQALSDSQAGSSGLPARVEQLNVLRLFRVYISEVVGMLRDKQAMGDQLQAAVLGMVSEQRGALRAARLELQEDECYQAGPDVGLGAYAPSSILRDVAALKAGGAGSVDQFGRTRPSLDSPFARQELARQLAARAADRVATLLDLPPVLEGLEGAEAEGYARDCQPSAAVCARLFSQADTLHRAAQCVMEDVRSEIRSIDHLLSRLADFRTAHGDKYTAAYTSLSLPPVLIPFALLDLLEELPLPQPGGGAVMPLRERGWFRAIQVYGQGGVGVAAEGESAIVGSSNADDASLLAKVLALGVLPLLARLCEGLDPLSAAHVAQAVDWLDCLERPETAGGAGGAVLATQPLWTAIFAQFEAALLGPSGELALVPVLPARSAALAGGAAAPSAEGEGVSDGVAAVAFACGQLRRVTVALAHLCLFKRLQLRSSQGPVAAGAGAGTGDGHTHVARIALQTCLRCVPACCALLAADARGTQALAAVWPLLRVTTKLVPMSLVAGVCRRDQVRGFEQLRGVVGVGRGLETGREAELAAALEALR